MSDELFQIIESFPTGNRTQVVMKEFSESMVSFCDSGRATMDDMVTALTEMGGRWIRDAPKTYLQAFIRAIDPDIPPQEVPTTNPARVDWILSRLRDYRSLVSTGSNDSRQAMGDTPRNSPPGALSVEDRLMKAIEGKLLAKFDKLAAKISGSVAQHTPEVRGHPLPGGQGRSYRDLRDFASSARRGLGAPSEAQSVDGDDYSFLWTAGDHVPRQMGQDYKHGPEANAGVRMSASNRAFGQRQAVGWDSHTRATGQNPEPSVSTVHRLHTVDGTHPDYTYDSMMRSILGAHDSVRAMVETKKWPHNQFNLRREATTVAVCLDLLRQANYKDAKEVLARRLQAVFQASEQKGSWKVARHLESRLASSVSKVISPAHLKHAWQMEKLRRSVDGFSNKDDSDSDTNGARGGNSRRGQ